MSANMQSLLMAVCPDFPDDRNLKETYNMEAYYRIMDSTLFVPPIKVLRFNYRELDNFCEAVEAFSRCDLAEARKTIFNWTDLDVHWPQSEQACIDWIHRIRDHYGGLVSSDIESCNLGWDDNAVLATGFGYNDNGAVSISILTDPVLYALQELYSSKQHQFVWHNGKFDTTRLKFLLDIDARVDEDTQLLHYISINERKGTHGLKDLGRLYLQAPAWEDQLDQYKREWCRRNKVKLGDFTYDLVPIRMLIPYHQKDLIATRRLRQVLEPLRRPGSEFLYNKLIKASAAIGKVELAGVLIDDAYIQELAEILTGEINGVLEQVQHLVDRYWNATEYVKQTGAKSVPKEFNMSSTKQLAWLLERMTGSKVTSTAALALEELAAVIGETNPQGSEMLQSLKTLRQSSKYMDTYVTGLLRVRCDDHRIRCSLNLHGTETGRLSSSEPNMQNIPRNSKIKNLIVARPGYRLIQWDYSQAELRVLAELSKDPWLAQVYIDKKDLHSAVALQMFGEGFTKEDRNKAKTINFGIAFGRGAASIAQHFNIPLHQAQQLIDAWFKPMPEVKKYILKQRRIPRLGECVTTPLGFVRHFTVTSENLNHCENEAINTPIQGTASYMTLFSLIDIVDWMDVEMIDGQIILTVHDSIIGEVIDDEETVMRVALAGREIMRNAPKKYLPNSTVPFEADVETGYRWGELKKLELPD